MGDRWVLTSRNEVSGKVSKGSAGGSGNRWGLFTIAIKVNYQNEGPTQLTYFIGVRSATQEYVHPESLVIRWKTCF